MTWSNDDGAGTLYDFFRHGRHKAIHRWHHYFDIYERHFRRLLNRQVKMLEIGVYKGGSLQMWKSYFAPGSAIFGIDIDPSCKEHAEPGIEVFIGDSADHDFLRDVLRHTGPLDIVIDDGGHTATQQIEAFEVLYPCVGDDGVYLVEDIHTSFWSDYMDRPDGKTFLDFAHERTRALHEWTGRRENFGRFALPPAEREGEIDVSQFCQTTGSIHFYDSIVVFEKSRRSEPKHEMIGTRESNRL